MRKIILASLLFWLSLSFQMSEAQGATAPYLYYYSDTLRSFVLERADGTDSRVLSQVVMPEDTTDIRIRGWSPSGEWLAWRSSSTLPGGNTRNSVWAANIDGVHSLEMLADVGNVYDMIWSPTEDLLFLSDWEQTTSGFNYQAVSTLRFFLIDAQTRTTITTFEMEISFANLGPAAWRLDGQYVTFEYSVDTEDSSESFIRRISRTGEIEDIPIPHRLENAIHITSHPSPNDWVLTKSEDSSQLIAANVISGETIEFEVPSPIERVYLYQWNYTRDYALIYVRTPESGNKFELWLLSIPDQTLQIIASNVGNYGSETGSWFPWSFYANHAIYYTDEGLFALELQPTMQISQITTDQVSLFSPQWYRDGRLFFEAGTVDDNGNWNGGTYVYNFLTDELSEQDSRFSPYRISGDERFAVVENPLSVVDSVQGQVFPIQSDSRVQSYMYLLESVHWYLNGPWFITAEAGMTVDGNLRFMSVNNIDGTVHRELASCFGSCASWLPDHVVAHVDSE